MVICLELGADLHMAQLMLLPLTDSCFNKIQIDFTFLVPADPGSPGKRTVKRVFVFLSVSLTLCSILNSAIQKAADVLLSIVLVSYSASVHRVRKSDEP